MDAGTDAVIIAVGKPLNGPLGLTLAPNGDLLTVNGGDNDLVELTRTGSVVAVRGPTPHRPGRPQPQHQSEPLPRAFEAPTTKGVNRRRSGYPRPDAGRNNEVAFVPIPTVGGHSSRQRQRTLPATLESGLLGTKAGTPCEESMARRLRIYSAAESRVLPLAASRMSTRRMDAVGTLVVAVGVTTTPGRALQLATVVSWPLASRTTRLYRVASLP